jgi:hypothetical protein
MDLKEVGWEGVDYIHLAQCRDQCWAIEHGNEPSDSIKDGEFFDYSDSFSRRILLRGVSKFSLFIVYGSFTIRSCTQPLPHTNFIHFYVWVSGLVATPS